MADTYNLGLADLRLIARDHGELVYSTDTHSVFVDANQWPPRQVRRDWPVRFAARQTRGGKLDGAWLVYTTVDPGRQRWTLKLFETICAEEPLRDDPDPMPFRDFSPFLGELDEATRARESESWHRIESFALCGPLPVVVPRYCGLGGHRRPWVWRAGVWAEDQSLPAIEKTLAEAASTFVAPCVSMHSGYILVWQGRLYMPMTDHFVDYCAAPVTLGRDRGPPVPTSEGGLFALQGTQLVEIHIDHVREHLPGIGVHSVMAGPSGAVIVDSDGGWLLYDPTDCEIAELAPIMAEYEIAGAASDGSLILFRQEHATLRRVTPEQLAALAWRAVDAATEPPAPPVRILDHHGAASRPITAGVGDIVINCAADAVRFWNLDIPSFKVPQPGIAIAVRGDRVGVLDQRGVLHQLELSTGANARGGLLITGRPRSLLATHDRWFVIGEDAVWSVGDNIERIAVEGAFAAAADPADGTLVILAEDRRLARWEAGQLFDIPESAEQLVAIAALGGRRFVCAGERNLFLLDLAQLELEALYAQNESPFLAASPNGKSIAWATHQSVTIAGIEGNQLRVIESSHYPDTFIEPEGEPLRIRGIAFLDDERITVAITAGMGGEILDFVTKKTKKLDPHPGDTRNRYLHTWAGVVYVAEDP